MSHYIKKSGSIDFHYGYDDKVGEYWYQVFDKTRANMNNGLVEQGGTKTNGMPPLVLAEKLKKFGADKEHIRRVLWMRKI
jgi:hypothetical protein